MALPAFARRTPLLQKSIDIIIIIIIIIFTPGSIDPRGYKLEAKTNIPGG